MLICHVQIFFKINFFEKFFQLNTIRVSNSLDPEIKPTILSDMIWVQSVCKCYQQTKQVRRVNAYV